MFAVVDSDVVMQSELDARIDNVHRQLSERSIALPPANVLKMQVLEQLVLEHIQLCSWVSAPASALTTGH